jgi:hypothetical protein
MNSMRPTRQGSTGVPTDPLHLKLNRCEGRAGARREALTRTCRGAYTWRKALTRTCRGACAWRKARARTCTWRHGRRIAYSKTSVLGSLACLLVGCARLETDLPGSVALRIAAPQQTVATTKRRSILGIGGKSQEQSQRESVESNLHGRRSSVVRQSKMKSCNS